MEYSNNIKRLREILGENKNPTKKINNVTEDITCKLEECKKKADATKNEKEKLKVYESFFTAVLATTFEGVKTIL